MNCDWDKDDVCKICERPALRRGYARNCPGPPKPLLRIWHHQAPAPVQHAPAQMLSAVDLPCIHRSDRLREEGCQLCGQGGRTETIYRCAKHGECSANRWTSGRRGVPTVCLTCRDREAPSARVALPEPLAPVELADGLDFDRVLVVNLDRRPDRWQQFLDGCPEPLRAKAKRFSATDGREETAPSWWNHRGCQGCWGCRRSQERLLAQCVTDGVESVLIFEDDAMPVADFADRWELLQRTVPAGWQILWLGGNLLEQPRKISEAIYAPRGIYTCHALAIRQPAMGKLLAMLRDESRWNDEINPDVTYSNYAASEPGGVYCPARWLFNQRGGKSDIRGIDAEPGVFVDACDYGRGAAAPAASKLKIDRALVINLDSRPDRLAAFHANYPAELPCAERLPATDGHKVKAPAWFRDPNPSVWGIYDSHRRLLESCHDVETVLLFEDDAVPSPRFAELWPEFIDALPANWQMCWLGGNQMDRTKRRINRHVWFPGKLHACHAILFKQPLIKELAAFLAKPQNEAHVDHVYAWYCTNRTDRVYAPGHWLFHQAAGFSDHTRQPTRLFTGRDLDDGHSQGPTRWVERTQPCDVGPDGACRRARCRRSGLAICRVGLGMMEVSA